MKTNLLKKGSLKDMAFFIKEPSLNPACKIRANNDVEAMERWLDEYFDKPTTFRTYKKEAERFLVWCGVVRSTNLSNLNRDDIESYIDFLKNPSPKEIWCGPRHKKTASSEHIWYPFAGPLKESAIKTALACLNSLMSYLMDARYIDFNPFLLVRKKSRFKRNVEEQGMRIHERILQDFEWRALLETIEEEPEHDHVEKFKKNRLKFLVTILFFLGLRIDELARAKWEDCKKLNNKWWFFVRGKGDRLGKVPINSELLQAIMKYRYSIDRMPIPSSDDVSPLIHSITNQELSLTTRQMSNLIKDVAQKAAAKFDERSPSREKLLRFSPHWLRHLSASRQDLAGISFTNIKDNLRHQNEQTTRIYVHAYDEHRHKEMEKLKLK